MAQTGYTPILIYSSSTGGNAPAAGNLTNSSLGSELAINITDGKLFYKDNANAVQVIGWKVTPTSAGGTGLTSYTAGDTLYYSSGTTLSKLAIGGSGYYMSSSGTAPQWSAPAALTKTDDTNVTLTLGGSASTALLNAASLTLGWTGQLAVSRGGTGIGTYTAGDLLYASGTTTLSKLAIGTANYVLTSSGSAPQWTAGSSVSVGTASNLLSNATTGVMQIVGPAASTTRVMTIPNANFTVARTDAAQTFTGTQTAQIFSATDYLIASSGMYVGKGSLLTGSFAATDLVLWNANADTIYLGPNATSESASYKFTSALLRIPGNITVNAAAKGVNFTANSAAAGMTSQLLNWYEEGTFTPTVFGGTTAGTCNYTVQIGRYTRIGRQVTVNIYLEYNTHTGTGTMNFGGLPYAASTFFSAHFGLVNNLALTANNVLTGTVQSGDTTILLRQYPVGGGAASSVSMDAGAEIICTAVYFV